MRALLLPSRGVLPRSTRDVGRALSSISEQGNCLYPLGSFQIAVTGQPKTLRAVADFYRVKFAGGTLGARGTVTTVEQAVAAFESDGAVRAKAAKLLIRAFNDGIEYVGDPDTDWQIARARLHGATELEELFGKVRLLRLFKQCHLA